MTEVTDAQLDAIIENATPEIIPEVVEESQEVEETQEETTEDEIEQEEVIEEQPQQRKKTTYKDDMIKERRKRQDLEARLAERDNEYNQLAQWIQENAVVVARPEALPTHAARISRSAWRRVRFVSTPAVPSSRFIIRFCKI